MRRVSWWQRFRTWATGSQKSDPSVLVARTELSSAQREIADELEGAFVSYQERLQDLAARLSMLDDEGILAEGETIRGVQQSLRRAVRRAAMSERSTQELMNEWQDWARYAFHGPLAQTLVDERQEMLRSELALRGVRLENPVGTTHASIPRENPELEEPPINPSTILLPQNFPEAVPGTFVPGTFVPGTKVPGTLVPRSATPTVDDFVEWDEMIPPAVENEVAHWEKMLTDYPLEFGNAAHLADLIHRRRDAHARLVALERLS